MENRVGLWWDVWAERHVWLAALVGALVLVPGLGALLVFAYWPAAWNVIEEASRVPFVVLVVAVYVVIGLLLLRRPTSPHGR